MFASIENILVNASKTVTLYHSKLEHEHGREHEQEQEREHGQGHNDAPTSEHKQEHRK